MQRFTARLVLLFAMLGVSQPFVQTLYGTPPHACCLRQLHARQNERPQLGQVATRSGNCCPSLTTPRSASTVTHNGASIRLQFSGLSVGPQKSFHAARYSSNQPSRAPPEPSNS
jgi:hypothetical protein